MNESHDAARSTRPLPVVVGAGAGSTPSLRALLDGLGSDAPLALLLVLRDIELSADLARDARCKTLDDGQPLEPAHLYLVPHDRDLDIRDGRVFLLPTFTDPAPIDRAIRSVSSTNAGACACVVLSGAGPDGAIGLKRMKEDGGLTIAQDPTEAAVDDMPRAAIATGLVDLVLPASEIGPRLVELAARLLDPSAAPDERRSAELHADTLRDILGLVRVRSGHDFNHYKRATLLRRIARRMQACRTESLAAYLRHLRESPAELPALLRDFMISVTNFFRDAESFETLQRTVLARVFARREPGQQVRIWVAGCATGEEAYSLAILCAEQLSSLSDRPQIQIFATDIHQEALIEARAGLYPSTIRSDVSDQRLEKYFTRESSGSYRVRKEIREMVLFSLHNLLRDPPFSKLDLVTCRNLLIYLDRDGQERVLGIVHFGLRPDGHLMLGSSESAESTTMLFAPTDAKHRIYARRQAPTSVAFAQTLPSLRWPSPALVATASAEDRSISFGEIHHRLVEHYAPPSVLVNDELDVVHVSEHAGRYLNFAGGEPTRNLVRLVPEGLRLDVRAAVYGAQQGLDATETRTVRASIEGTPRLITITARAVQAPDPSARMMLVMFEERGVDSAVDSAGADVQVGSIEPVVRQLEDELHRTRDHLRTTVEQYETSVEELKASNEELHAINEELRSASEELETSQEELQSVNEELTTLNYELKDKIDEVSRAKADLQNLMSSTEIGVVFLDRAMRIKSFTPRAQDVFNIIAGDVGRPLAHVTHRLEGIDLGAELTQVLQQLSTVERAVRGPNGTHYLARMHPYRSMDDHIEGVVLTFLDVTQLRLARDSVQARDEMLRLAEHAAEAGFWEIDARAETVRLSEEYQRILGLPGRDGAIPVSEWLRLVDERDRPRLEDALTRAASKGDDIDLEIRVRDPVRGDRWLWHTGRADRRDATRSRVAGITIDVTHRRTTEAALRRSEERFRSALLTAPVIMLSQDAELRYTWGYGFGAELDVLHKTDHDLFPAAQADTFVALKREVLESGRGRRAELPLTFRGHTGTWDVSIEPVRDERRIVGVNATAVDVSASKNAERTLRDADRRKDEFLATLAHELRNPLAPIRSALDLQKLAGDDLVLLARARDQMDRQLVQIVRLVDDLMDVGRITSGRIHLRRHVFPIAAAVNDAVEATRHAFDAAGHQLSVTLADPELLVDADRARITQVLTNVLGNAAKYTRAGGRVSLGVRTLATEPRLEIRVEDDGAGIDADVLPRVFDMFAQGASTLDRAQGGLGVGLSLVKQLVELHHGTVAAFSAGRAKGTQIVIRLPWDGPSVEGAPADLEVRSDGPRRVLIVDDHPDVTEVIAQLLTLRGHHATQAHDARSALETFEANRFDIVFVDIALDDADGYDTARRIRALAAGRDVTLVAMSGRNSARDEDDPRDRAFDHYLTKPADLGQIEELVLRAKPQS